MEKAIDSANVENRHANGNTYGLNGLKYKGGLVGYSLLVVKDIRPISKRHTSSPHTDKLLLQLHSSGLSGTLFVSVLDNGYSRTKIPEISGDDLSRSGGEFAGWNYAT